MRRMSAPIEEKIMSETAFFIRHTAKPGRRDDLRRIWEKYVQDYVLASEQQPIYYYCYDNGDPDTIMVFQLHAHRSSGDEFTRQPWYADYERETAALLAKPSDFRSATPQWIKNPSS